MNSLENDSILFDGGPFVVALNKEGAITKNYGWASLSVQQYGEMTIISILCNNLCENISDLVIHRFQINNKIPKEQYENISIMLHRGFNTIYHGNFSNIENFKKFCENYFKNVNEK